MWCKFIVILQSPAAVPVVPSEESETTPPRPAEEEVDAEVEDEEDVADDW